MSPTRGSPVWRALRAAARSAATRDSARAPLCGVGDEKLEEELPAAHYTR